MKKLKVILSGLFLLSILWVGSSSGFGILADQSQVVGSPGGASSTSPFVTIGNDASLTHERALTGTTNQVIVTDDGLNTTVTLSIPQNIHTGASPTFAGLTLSTTPLVVSSGGIGVATLTDGGILLGSGTSAITALGVATDGQIPIGDGVGDPVLATLTGTANEVDITNASGSITIGLPNNVTIAGITTHGGNVVSDTDSTDDLGTTGARWANLWTDIATITNNATIGGTLGVTGVTTHGGNVISDTDSTDDLGNTTVAWANTWVDTYNIVGSTSGDVSMIAPATVTSYTVTWPAAQASGTQVLENNGSGVLSWASASGAVTALNNATESELVTVGATTTELDAESALTFDGSTLRHSGSSFARYIIDHPGAAADEKLYDYVNLSGRLIMRALSDAVGVGQTFVEMDRTGIIIDTIAFETGRADFAFGTIILGGSFMAFTVDGVPRNMISGRGLGFYIFSSSQIVNTSGSGETIANGALVIFGQPTWRSSGTTFTITDASTLYIENAPVASTNTTFTREYAAWFDDGDIRIDGVLRYGNQVNVSQGTDINTAVTSDGNTGAITTQTASTGIGNSDTFTVNNSLVVADDVIDVSIQSYGGTLETNGLPVVLVTTVAAGSFDVSIYNVDGTNALSGIFVINYAIRGGGIS